MGLQRGCGYKTLRRCSNADGNVTFCHLARARYLQLINVGQFEQYSDIRFRSGFNIENFHGLEARLGPKRTSIPSTGKSGLT